jgi:hypothetical protein
MHKGNTDARAMRRKAFIFSENLLKNAVNLGLAFRKLYLVPRTCAPGTACDEPRVIRRQRLTFRAVAALLLTLLLVPGVAEAKIDYDHKTATVKFDPEKASAAALVKATEAGFPATPHSSKP